MIQIKSRKLINCLSEHTKRHQFHKTTTTHNPFSRNAKRVANDLSYVYIGGNSQSYNMNIH